MKQIGRRAAAWLMLALMLASMLALPAMAESAEVPLTWAEWEAAHDMAGADMNFETAAGAIDEVIDRCVALYEAGDKDEAYKYARATYWGYYETTGFERNVNVYMTGSDVTKAELQFTALRTAVKKDKGLDAVKQAGADLSATMHAQGTSLNQTLGIASSGAAGAAVTLEGGGLDYDGAEAILTTEVPLTWAEWEAAHDLAGADMNFETAAGAIDEVILKAAKLYEQGDKDEAYKYARATYLGYYETTGFERNVNVYMTGSDVTKAELQFTALRTAVKKDKGLDAVKQAGNDLSATMHEQGALLNDRLGIADGGAAAGAEVSAETSRSLAVATFFGAFGIILREGLEAILIVGAIVAYLIKSGNRAACKPVYIGAAFAVICSFGMAAIIAALKRASAENAMSQEIIEGVAALLAVAVLFYVSNWMVSKAESAAWNQYIEGKVAAGASRGSMFTLGFTAWLAVFREGAEVILFYQPLLQENNANMVWAGFGVGCLALVVVFVVIRFLSIKLPLKPFFLGTSILMALMSVCFLGSGIKELMEGGVINAAYHDWFVVTDVLDIFGIYPVFATLIPQVILLLVQVATFSYQIGKSKGLTLAQSAKA